MKQHDSNERKWHLAAKVLTDGLDPNENLEWQELLKDQKFKEEFGYMQKHWDDFGALPYYAINKVEDWNSVAAKLGKSKTARKTIMPAWRYAATVLLLVTASILARQFWLTQNNAAIATTIEAPNGARTFITLPDSSKVWLNAGSRISFAQGFGSDHRHLELEGEAFFDVKKSPTDFTVHTKSFDIAVLGTAFNISAYPGDELVSATLIRGSLKVIRELTNGEREEIVLRPNQKAVIRATTRQPMILENNIDGLAEAEWKDGWLTVRGSSLSDLSRKIERLYNVRIRFENDSLKNFRYNGRIQQLSLEQVLTALALTSPVKFTINGKEVVFSENELTKSKYETQ